jgi:hypothetical protein
MADVGQWDKGHLRGGFSCAIAVMPSDSLNLVDAHSNPFAASALYIGGSGSGNLKVTMEDGETEVFAGLTAHFILPIRVSRVWSTGTDVTGIVALK